MKMIFWIIMEQPKNKRLSSPQDLGAPPEIPEGEDSLKNWPRLKPTENDILDNNGATQKQKALITSGFGRAT